MSADYLPNKEADLGEWLKTFATVVSTHVQELGLTAEQVTQIGNNSTLINNDLSTLKATRATLRGQIKTKNQNVKAVIASTRKFVNQIQGNANVPVLLKEQLGINPRDTPRTNTPPVTPTDLKVKPQITGTNNLTWKRADNKPATNYVIEARYGMTGPYIYLAGVTKTKFQHTGQTLGTLVWYRVRAERGGMASDWCEAVAAYGNGTSGDGESSGTNSKSRAKSRAAATAAKAKLRVAA